MARQPRRVGLTWRGQHGERGMVGRCAAAGSRCAARTAHDPSLLQNRREMYCECQCLSLEVCILLIPEGCTVLFAHVQLHLPSGAVPLTQPVVSRYLK